MLKYMMIARAARGNQKLDMAAHANLSCRISSLANRWNAFTSGVRGMFSS